MSFKKNTNQTVIREETYACSAKPGDDAPALVSVNLRSVNDFAPALTLNFHVPGRKNPVQTVVTRRTLADLRDMFSSLCEDLS